MYSNAQIKWFTTSKIILNQRFWKGFDVNQLLKGFIKRSLKIIYWKQMHKKRIHKRENYGSILLVFNCLYFTHQIPQTHENRSNLEVTIVMFIFLDSSHPIPSTMKTYRDPKAPKKPPNKKHLTPWYPQLPTNNTKKTP